GVSSASLLAAPRSLNDPVRCSISSLKWTCAPQSSVKLSEMGHGVSEMSERMRSRAAWTSARVTMRRGRLAFPGAWVKQTPAGTNRGRREWDPPRQELQQSERASAAPGGRNYPVPWRTAHRDAGGLWGREEQGERGG